VTAQRNLPDQFKHAKSSRYFCGLRYASIEGSISKGLDEHLFGQRNLILRLSFNEIRVRAAQFADSYADAAYEKGDTQTFYNDFFGIFGVERRSVARYEEHVKKLNNRSGFIDFPQTGLKPPASSRSALA
jgi:hypothetical protein